MAGNVDFRLPPQGFHLLLAAILLLIGSVLTYQGLVQRSVQVTQGPKRGPPSRVWRFTGTEAIRIGCGAASLILYGLAVTVDAAVRGRRRWGWRLRGIAAMSLLAAATLLFFPPWQLRIPSIIAGCYAFLIPSLAGVCGGRPLTVFTGLGLGVALSVAAAWGEPMNGMMAGLLPYLFLAPHLAFLVHARLRPPPPARPWVPSE
jgi:hypothetical protein